MTNTMLRLAAFGLTAAMAALGADHSLLSLLNPDAQTFAGVQVDQAKNTALGQILLKQLPATDTHFQKFVSDSGFDPRRDLREFVVSTGGKGSPNLAVVRGAFDLAKISALATREGASITKYQGFDVISHGDADWVAFAENSIAVLGKASEVKAALARRQAGKSLDSATLNRIDKLSSANDAWFTSTSTELLAPGSTPARGKQVQGPMQAFQAIQQASGGVRLGSVVQVSVEAVARSAKDATALADVVRMFGSLSQSQSKSTEPRMQGMMALLDKVDIQASGNSVKVLLPIPQAQVEQWIQDTHKPRASVRKTSVSSH